MLVVVFTIFFVVSFVTNILGAIVPDIIVSYRLSLTAAALLPFSFFIAYGVLSIPAGFMVERWGEKKIIIVSFAIAFAASSFFSLMPAYGVAIASLFFIGGCMAAIQVAVNPLLRTVGGEDRFAFNAALGQLVFGLASFMSPQLYAYIVSNMGRRNNPFTATLARFVPVSLPWVSMYWVFAMILLAITFAVAASGFPIVERTQDEAVGTAGMYRDLLRKPVVWLFFVSVFLYVGSEQGTANWISEFLEKYHGYSPHTVGAAAVAWFWGLLTIGCFLGLFLLRLFDSRTVLRGFSLVALLSLTAALFGSGPISKLAFPCVGLSASVMWPILISLALNSVKDHQGPLTGILCSGIVGGAFFPLLIGRIGDTAGLRIGLCLLYLSFGWILGVSFWARPLVTNKTIRSKKNCAAY